MSEIPNPPPISIAARRAAPGVKPPGPMAMPVLESTLPGGFDLATPREAREADPGPTWIRLTAASWAMIREEYLGGATAKQLALKWRTSPTSIYRHACNEGWTKESYALVLEDDALARAEAEAVARRAREKAVFAPATPAAADPAFDSPADGEQVAALALGAAARCIAAGRFAEAERLGKLAETLSRLGPGGGGLHDTRGGGRRGAGAAWDTDREDPDAAPEFVKEEHYKTPGEAKRSAYQVEMLRADVEECYERLAARFTRPGEDAGLYENDDA